MKYAIISDLHANESALRHVLEDAAACGAEQVICLGDVVGYGPLPAETLALVRRSVSTTLCGNHDDAVSGRLGTEDFVDLAGDAVQRHRDALKADDLAWLKTLPYTFRLEGAIATHGDFVRPSDFNYVDDEASAKRNFAANAEQLMFVGHTHVPGFFLTGQSGAVYWLEPQDFVLEEGKRYIVNPGSVGYPRENDGICRSSYVLYDSMARTVSFRFLPFAVASMLQRGRTPRRRMAVALGVSALVAIVLGTSVAFLLRKTDTVPKTVVRTVSVAAPDLSFARKSVTLGPDARAVCANLKIDRKGDPVDLRIEFKSASGCVVDVKTKTVKKSSTGPFPVPAGAVSAHFTLLRQREESRPTVLSFQPSAQ